MGADGIASGVVGTNGARLELRGPEGEREGAERGRLISEEIGEDPFEAEVGLARGGLARFVERRLGLGLLLLFFMLLTGVALTGLNMAVVETAEEKG